MLAAHCLKLREVAGEATTTFMRLLVPFVRRGLIEDGYWSTVWDVPWREELREVIENMNMQVREVGVKVAAIWRSQGPVPHKL